MNFRKRRRKFAFRVAQFASWTHFLLIYSCGPEPFGSACVHRSSRNTLTALLRCTCCHSVRRPLLAHAFLACARGQAGHELSQCTEAYDVLILGF